MISPFHTQTSSQRTQAVHTLSLPHTTTKRPSPLPDTHLPHLLFFADFSLCLSFPSILHMQPKQTDTLSLTITQPSLPISIPQAIPPSPNQPNHAPTRINIPPIRCPRCTKRKPTPHVQDLPPGAAAQKRKKKRAPSHSHPHPGSGPAIAKRTTEMIDESMRIRRRKEKSTHCEAGRWLS
jgi:hypothetical protein